MQDRLTKKKKEEITLNPIALMTTDLNANTTNPGIAAARKVVVIHSLVARMILAIFGIHID